MILLKNIISIDHKSNFNTSFYIYYIIKNDINKILSFALYSILLLNYLQKEFKTSLNKAIIT